MTDTSQQLDHYHKPDHYTDSRSVIKATMLKDVNHVLRELSTLQRNVKRYRKHPNSVQSYATLVNELNKFRSLTNSIADNYTITY